MRVVLVVQTESTKIVVEVKKDESLFQKDMVLESRSVSAHDVRSSLNKERLKKPLMGFFLACDTIKQCFSFQ